MRPGSTSLRLRMQRRMTTADDTESVSSAAIQVNRYFAEHPEMVLGEHAMRRGIYGPALTYTCRAAQGRRGA